MIKTWNIIFCFLFTWSTYSIWWEIVPNFAIYNNIMDSDLGTNQQDLIIIWGDESNEQEEQHLQGLV